MAARLTEQRQPASLLSADIGANRQPGNDGKPAQQPTTNDGFGERRLDGSRRRQRQQ
jgi:hypothetical protein